MASERDVERVKKLIALAADERNDSANERRNAALEACRLINKHNLEINLPGRKPQQSPFPSTPPPRYQSRQAPTEWGRTTEGRAMHDGMRCLVCKGILRRGEPIWVTHHGVMHFNFGEWPCSTSL